ncbi:FeoB-associated Cys-rich membrane protein [Corallibacter sp.]
MNPFIQEVLVITALVIAVGFLVMKFVWNPRKKSSSKNCGSGNDCGCH